MKNNFKYYCRKSFSCITAAVLLFSVVHPCVFAQSEARNTLEFYVSPDGADSGKGTIDDPFATIAAARDAVRVAKNGFIGDITVYLRGGRYYQESTLEFSGEDSGSDECTVTYKAYDEEMAVIEGAVTLDTNKFIRPADEDSTAARIKDSVARENVLVYDLSALNINYDNDQLAVYYNGKRALEARYPNEGYIMSFNDESEGHGGDEYQFKASDKTFYDKSNVVGTWTEPVGVKVIGMFEIDWASSDGKIYSYDPVTNRVGLSTKYFISPNSGRYYYSNIIEEIDMVGEYYIDSEADKLYFYAPEDYEDMVVSLSGCKETVVKAEVNNYIFDGVVIEGGYDDNIRITGNDNCIKNSKVRCCGDTNVYINGFRNTLYNNEISHSGAFGIQLYGGDSRLLIPSNSLIDNNRIHGFGEIYRVYNGAIYAEGIGFSITNNEMYDAPHTAFTNVACEMLFENNYIHDVCYEAGDAGAIYEGGWGSNGNVYRNNLLKDIVNNYSEYFTPMGYYVDNSGGGKSFISNVLVNIDGYAILCSGRDLKLTDNIMVNTEGFYFDQRGYYPGAGVLSGWAYETAFPSSSLWISMTPYDHVTGRIENAPAYATESWAIHYPWTMLMKTTNVVDLNDNYVSQAYGGGVIRNNVIGGLTGIYTISANPERLISIRDNVSGILAEDIFADYENGDYTIREDSKIYKLVPGFRAFDFSENGVQ